MQSSEEKRLPAPEAGSSRLVAQSGLVREKSKVVADKTKLNPNQTETVQVKRHI